MVDVVVGMALVATVLGVGVSINVDMWLSAESFCLQSMFTSTSHYNSSPNWCVYAKLTRLILHDVEVNICCKQKDSADSHISRRIFSRVDNVRAVANVCAVHV